MINNLENVKCQIRKTVGNLEDNIQNLKKSSNLEIPIASPMLIPCNIIKDMKTTSDSLQTLILMYERSMSGNYINITVINNIRERDTIILKPEEYIFIKEFLPKLENIITFINSNMLTEDVPVTYRDLLICYEKIFKSQEILYNEYIRTKEVIKRKIGFYLANPLSESNKDKIYNIDKLNYYCQWIGLTNDDIKIVSINEEGIKMGKPNGMRIIVNINDFME